MERKGTERGEKEMEKEKMKAILMRKKKMNLIQKKEEKYLDLEEDTKIILIEMKSIKIIIQNY